MNISDVRGVIFDVDDTLLSNHPPQISWGLHERSRVMAAQVAGKRHGIRGLQELTDAQAYRDFHDSSVHSLHGAIWQTLKRIGEVRGELDLTHPLILEMVALKDDLHEKTLRKHGREVPGATKFVKSLAAGGLEGKLAVASTSYRRDVLVFFDMANLHPFFPDKRIITREKFTHPKPHPESFELAFASLGLPGKTGVIAFEDDPRGVASAKGAGLFTCAITTRFSRDDLAKLDTPPDLIADSYAEFARLLGVSGNMLV
ncbi:MAG: HAD family hydrolase [Candidatus Saccharimonadales bacterium]